MNAHLRNRIHAINFFIRNNLIRNPLVEGQKNLSNMHYTKDKSLRNFLTIFLSLQIIEN